MSWLHQGVRLAYRRKRKWFPRLSLSARSPALAKLRAKMLEWLLSEVGEVRGQRMVVDAIDTLQLRRRRYYDRYATALFERILRPNQVAVDAGANVGYFTLLYAQTVGPGGHVYAFEPHPTNYWILQRNIELNGYRNVTAVQAVVADQPGTARLFLSPNNEGDHRAYDPGDARSSVPVPQVTLDNYLAGRRVDFIKTDLQGYEARALRGALKLLSSAVSLSVYLEWWPQGIKEAGGDCSVIYGMLIDCGFRVFDVNDQDQSVKPATLSELQARYGSQERPVGNILALKGVELP
jgi:FkbM family methyltransferase